MLSGKVFFAVVEGDAHKFDFISLSFNLVFVLFHALVAEHHFKLFRLYFFGEGIKLTVVLHVHLLLFVFLNQFFWFFLIGFDAGNLLFKFFDGFVELLNSGIIADNLIFQVLHLVGQIAAYFFDFVLLGVNVLQFQQSL